MQESNKSLNSLSCCAFALSHSAVAAKSQCNKFTLFILNSICTIDSSLTAICKPLMFCGTVFTPTWTSSTANKLWKHPPSGTLQLPVPSKASTVKMTYYRSSVQIYRSSSPTLNLMWKHLCRFTEDGYVIQHWCSLWRDWEFFFLHIFLTDSCVLLSALSHTPGAHWVVCSVNVSSCLEKKEHLCKIYVINT